MKIFQGEIPVLVVGCWGLSYIYIYILCMYQICVYDPGYILYIVRSTVIVFVYLYAYT